MDRHGPVLLGGVLAWTTTGAEEERVADDDADRDGTEAAFDALFLDRWDRMVRRAFLIVRSEATAEEVVQDAFAEVHRRWDRIERHEAYLARAVTTGAIRRADRARRERPLHPADDRPDRAAGGDERLTDRLLVEDLLASLAPSARAIVVLKFFDGLTEAEIADQVGCRPGTVGPTVTRALRRLAQEVERP